MLYGSFGAGSAIDQAKARAQARFTGPVFLENPDGTITEAIPSHHKDIGKKRARAAEGDSDRDTEGGGSNSDGLDTDPSIYMEIEALYHRHERIFVFLLMLQFFLEMLYAYVFVARMQTSLVEFGSMYTWQVPRKVAVVLFWNLFAAEVVYSTVYYTLVGLALWSRRPKRFQFFANWALLGAFGLVLLAYASKFNLPIFFLRLLAYIYARFLQGLCSSLLLLPPPDAPLQD